MFMMVLILIFAARVLVVTLMPLASGSYANLRTYNICPPLLVIIVLFMFVQIVKLSLART